VRTGKGGGEGPEEDWAKWEGLQARFDRAWQQGARPALEKLPPRGRGRFFSFEVDGFSAGRGAAAVPLFFTLP
jgi:hypothetical protein